MDPCKGLTKRGIRCKNRSRPDGEGFCRLHQVQEAVDTMLLPQQLKSEDTHMADEQQPANTNDVKWPRPSYAIGVFAVFVAVPAAIGYVTGWLAGGSQSPITATVLPLVFGLLGIAGFGAIGRTFTSGDLLKKIVRPETLGRLSAEMREELETNAAQQTWNPLIAAVGILVFSAFFFWGVQRGIAVRLPPYPLISTSFENVDLLPAEHAALFHFRQECRASGVSVEVYSELIQNAFLPVFLRTPLAKDGPPYDANRLIEFENVLRAAGGQVPASGIAETKETPEAAA